MFVTTVTTSKQFKKDIVNFQPDSFAKKIQEKLQCRVGYCLSLISSDSVSFSAYQFQFFSIPL